jgi:Holliday junction DNA helicase RuvA
MITFLEGQLEEKQPTRLVMNAGGVGYEVFIPLSSYDRVPEAGRTCRLLIYHHVREDAEILYGFSGEAERALFLLLLDVTGIGPKLALSVLSGLSVREIKAAIAGGDVKRLSSISGIGRKTAERIVVELKDKLGTGGALEALAGPPEEPVTDVRLRDAVLALVSLGYKLADAQERIRRAMTRVPAEAGVEELVKSALSG